MKIKITLLLLALGFSTFLTAQTATVFGTINEVGTNQPIEFAIVYVKETNKSARLIIAFCFHNIFNLSTFTPPLTSIGKGLFFNP